MPQRNRVISQTLALFSGPSDSTGYHFSSGNSGTNLVTQIHRVQSSSSNSTITRQDVNTYGKLARLDSIITEPPAVGFDFSYLLANVLNEYNLGFTVDGSAGFISGILNNVSDDRNYYKLTVKEGNDAIGNTQDQSTSVVEAIGNGSITNYSLSLAVGQIPTVSISVEGLNAVTYNGSTGLNSPAIIPESGIRVSNNVFTIPAATTGVAGMVSALRPGDIQFDFTNPQYGIDIASGAHIQSFDLSVPLSRTPLNRLGSQFPFARELDFPITVTASVTADVAGLITGSLSDIICNDRSYNMTVTLRKPVCGGTNGPIAARYQLLGAKLDSQEINDSIGANQSATLSFSLQLGGPQDQSSNIIVSGTLT